jgi:YggT family protein
MLTQIVQLLLNVFLHGFASILLLRFLLQWLRVPLRNPFGEFIMAVTDFAVLRARRFVPSIWLLDTATLLLAFLAELIYLVVMLVVLPGNSLVQIPLPGLMVLSVVELIKLSVYLLMGAIIAQAVLSWVNPHTPFASMLAAITERFLRPFRRILPLLGNVDLSPLLLLVVCQIILFAPIAMLENMAMQLF